MKPMVFITQWMPNEGVEVLKRHCKVIMNEGMQPLPKRELIRQAKDAHALLFFVSDHIDAEVIEGCPNLKVVASFGKGYDNLDLNACTRRNICATINPYSLTDSTADLALALMLALCRNLLPGDRFIRSGNFRGWEPRLLLGHEFHHKNLGIIGMGAIGQAIARRAVGFNVRILYYDLLPRPAVEAELGATFCTKEQLLSQSDFVVLCVDLRPENYHLIGARDLQKIKRGSYLINVGRGSLVDEQAVVQALEDGVLGGYAADVFEMEDFISPSRPTEITPGLIRLKDKTVLTPHIGTGTWEARRKLAVATAEQILKALHGEKPPGALNDVVLQPLL